MRKKFWLPLYIWRDDGGMGNRGSVEIILFVTLGHLRDIQVKIPRMILVIQVYYSKVIYLRPVSRST